MTQTFQYRDPVVATEKFLEKVRVAYANRSHDVNPIGGEWDDGTYMLTSSTGNCLALNLMTGTEYSVIAALVHKFNLEEIPRPCEFA